MNFSDFNFHSLLLENLKQLGYKTPTIIQVKAIPEIQTGKDVLGIAQTGTGKTATFCLPLIDRVLKINEEKVSPKILVLAPTRELCLQIHSSIEKYTLGSKIKSCAIYGGVGQADQAQSLREGVHIIVATPGRLLDLSQQRLVRLADLQAFVIDEADRMLDMGFIDDLKLLLERLPSKRQNLLFSATMPPAVKSLASSLLHEFVTVEASRESSVGSNIEQKVIFCKKDHKYQLLKKIIKEECSGPTLVFAGTKIIADTIVEYLAQNRIASRAIHGDKNQTERERSIVQFSEGSMKILIATDLVSRGIDVDGIGHVINFDLPLDPENYVHRIGRTARAGRTGKAISFCDDEDKHKLSRIEHLTQMKIPTEVFQGKSEPLKLKNAVAKKTKAPTPGKSQEKTSWLDHSKRQRLREDGKKLNTNPAFKKKKKKR